MRHFTVRQFAKACQAQYFGPEEVLEQEIHGVVIDNRQIEEGYLFAAVAGERVDGHSLKGRGLGKEMDFAWTAKGSHFGGAGERM